MTEKELWEAVGTQLLLRRTKLGLKPFHITKKGGPNYRTVSAIEKGEVGRVDRVEDYARIVGLSLVDILRSVFAPEQVPLSPEATKVLDKFRRTTPGGRSLLYQMALELPVAGPEALSEPEPAREPALNDRPVKPKPRQPNGKRRK